MSQEKVDRYKKEKANRAKIMKKQKIKHIFSVIGGIAVLCLVAVFIIISGYKKWGPQEETTTPKYVSQVDADTLRETLIAQGVITTTAAENEATTEEATTEAATEDTATKAAK